MKKFFTLILGVSLVFGVVAQDGNGKNRKAIPVKLDKNIEAQGSYSIMNSKDIPFAVPVGVTNYDLQTNDGVARRLISHGDGTFSTVWIQYHGTNMPNAPERGTGYNHFDGSSWLYTEMSGNPTIDGTQRTGWPAIVALENGNEFVVNHASSSGYYGWTQSIGASGSNWSQQNAGASQPLLWPRAASSGNTIHTFGVVDYDITYNDQSPAPVYMKSEDGGSTWGALIQPDGIGSTYFDGIGGDSYAIDANGDVVAIVVFDIMSDFALFKSEDGGDTWTKKIIADFPVDLYSWSAGVIIDEETDGVADTCTTVNGADVVVDANGVVHVGFSSLLIVDDDAGDDAASYFYGFNNGIHYWNDTMAEGNYDGTPSTTSFHELYMGDDSETWVGWTPDVDGSGIIGDGITGTGSYGFAGWCGFPSIAMDASDNVYISYSATMEGDDYLKTDAFPEPQNFKHVLISQKIDGAWLDPIDVTSVDGTNAENIFCTLAKNTYDNTLYMQLQWDNEPGCSLKEDAGEPITENYMLFKGLPLPIGSSSIDFIKNEVSVNVFPNPVSDVLNIMANNLNYIELFNVVGKRILFSNKNEISLKNISSGTYILKVHTDNGIATKKVQKF